MRRIAALVLALTVAIRAAGCGSGRSSSTATTASRASALVSIGAGLRGPAGLHATVYARGPKTLSTLAFDAQGRLWAGASGLSSHTRDGIYLLGRGANAAPTRIISGLDDPLGLLWYANRLYVASVGRVEVYSGLRGSRFAHRRRVLDGPVRGGENNNLVLALGGRLVMGVTATCDHCRPRSRYSGAVVSFTTAGQDLRVVASHVRAPVGLTYAPGTATLFATMNLRDDLGARTPGDWLGVIRQGQDWGSPQCYGQGGSACAGVPAPTSTLDPHAAAGGVAIVTGQLGPGIGTSAVVAEWQRALVRRVALSGAGHTRGSAATPFLRGMTNPLPVVLAPDGALLVGDWNDGRVYRITGHAAAG
jgi:glucose/arabinose dehydrogenase